MAFIRELVEQKATIVARLRARATSEDVTAYRLAQGGNDRVEAMHRMVADVLREEATRIEHDV